MIQTNSYISGKAYGVLFEKGGDDLVAFYMQLLKARKDLGVSHFCSYKTSKNRIISGVGVIRSKAKVSKSVIDRLLPMLIELEFAVKTEQGHVILHGVDKINKRLYGTKDVKYVPFKTTTYKENKLYSYFVRIASLEDAQKKAYSKKRDIEKNINLVESEKVSFANYKKCIRDYKRFQKNPDIISGMMENVVLSNQGYAMYKDLTADNKSKGVYWKRKLTSEGLVSSKRRWSLTELNFALKGKNLYSLSEAKSVIRNSVEDKDVSRYIFSVRDQKIFREEIASFNSYRFNVNSNLINYYTVKSKKLLSL